MKKYIIILLSIAFLSCSTHKMYADDFAVGVYPPILQIQATVPTIITKNMTIVNASDHTENVQIVLRQFQQTRTNSGQITYLPATQKPSPDADLFKRVQILDEGNPVNTLSLAPKQKKTISLRIGLPKDEPGADYYFSLIFLSASQVTQTINGSHIAAGIATNVLLSIGPKDATSGFLDSFTTPWFTTSGPIPFTVLVSNTSRHFVNPTGQILIRNMFGQLIGKTDILPVNVLGNSSRFMISKGDQILTHPVVLWNEKALFGPYRANIIISLSSEGPILTKTIYFFVMPIQYIIGFFLVATLAVIIFERVRHRMQQV